MPSDPLAGLDVEAVTKWIAALDVGALGPLSFARLGHGNSNLTYLVSDAADGRWVLRRPPLGPRLASAHDVAREQRILTGLAGTAVPAPRVLGLTADPVVTDAPLLLMTHVEGLVVDSPTVAEALAPPTRHAIGLSLARTLARIHDVDLDGAGLSDLAAHTSYAARQLKRWRRQWNDSRTRDAPAVEQLAERLERALPEQHEVTLVHGDFHLSNAIVDPVTGEVRAVLDWELCTLGDPVADLGALLAYWSQPGETAGAVFPASSLPGFPSRGELAAAYADATGRDLAALGFWHALALWKIAVIYEGIRRRALDRGGDADEGGFAAHVVDELIAKAVRVAVEAGL